jgi:hypothetical protein
MLGTNVKRNLAIAISAAVVLASAGSASAAITLSSHPAVGTRVTDGTSNTIMFEARTADAGTGPAVIESIGTKYAMSRPLDVAGSKNEVAIETIEAPAAPHQAPSVRTRRARA